MKSTSLDSCLQVASELQQCVQEGDDCLLYQAQLSRLGKDIEFWIGTRQATGLSTQERTQLEQVLSLFRIMNEQLATQRKALHGELYQLNSAKKISTTYSP